MIFRLTWIVVLLGVFASVIANDEEYTGRLTPENDENIDYSLGCQCLAPASNLEQWASNTDNKNVLDQMLRSANDAEQMRHSIKYFNGPWSWQHDFGPNGFTCVRNINHRGFIVRNAVYETEAEKQAILQDWNNNPVRWRPPNTIIEYGSLEKEPSYDNIPE